MDEYLQQPENYEKDLSDLEASTTDKSLFLDKSWEGIHYLLIDENIGEGEGAWALTIYSQKFFDEEQDFGYGPASYLTPEQVIEISSKLSYFNKEKLRERYNPKEIDELAFILLFGVKNLMNFLVILLTISLNYRFFLRMRPQKDIR